MDWLIAPAYAAEEGHSYPGGVLGDPKTWVAIGVLAFFAILWFSGAIKAVLGLLDQRSARIAAELAEAERLRSEAQVLLAEAKLKALAADAESRAILAQAKADAETLRGAARRELDEDLARRERITDERIGRAEEQVRAEAHSVAVDAAISTAEKLLREQMNAKAHGQLFDDALTEMSARFGKTG